MQKLIEGSTMPMVGQSGVSYSQFEQRKIKSFDDLFDGITVNDESSENCSMHSQSNAKMYNTIAFAMDFLTTETKAEEGLLTLKWYRMFFREDFGEYLEKFKRLPYDSVEKSMNAHKDKDEELRMMTKKLLEAEI